MISSTSRVAIREFVAAREWHRFHTPDALARSVAIEAGELLECFQWSADADEAAVRQELADVLIYCVLLADAIGADLDEIVTQKLRLNETRYPVALAKGKATKHDRL